MTTDFLSSIVSKMEQTQVDLDAITNKNENSEKVVKIHPDNISNWEFRDRQDFELGDINALAESIITKGQAQPIIIVEKNNLFKPANDHTDVDYIVIAGYRRWLACKSRNINVDAIIRKLSFEQAIACLVSENEKEKVSDYSKGIFYYNILKNERITKKELYERLGINRGVFDNFLSFAEVPQEVWDSVKDMSNVSSRTSATIKSICQKGEKEKMAIIAIAKKIASGIGEKKINALVNKILIDRKEDNATRVTFRNNYQINIKKDSLVISTQLKNKDMHKLKEKITEVMNNYFEETGTV